MTRDRIVIAPAIVLALGTLLACQKQPPKTAATAPPVKAAAPVETPVAAPPAANSGRDLEADVLSQDLATLNRKGYLGDAFFDFDKSLLREDARSVLAKDAEWLRKYPSIQILLAGHCDDRGTEGYNLALGERRASASRDYLVALGLSEARIKTVSYGKEKPFCSEDNEQCWQENRRAHVLMTAK